MRDDTFRKLAQPYLHYDIQWKILAQKQKPSVSTFLNPSLILPLILLLQSIKYKTTKSKAIYWCLSISEFVHSFCIRILNNSFHYFLYYDLKQIYRILVFLAFHSTPSIISEIHFNYFNCTCFYFNSFDLCSPFTISVLLVLTCSILPSRYTWC